MNLQELLNKKHFSYNVGYMHNGEFWCIHEASSLEKAQELVQQNNEIFQNEFFKSEKREYLIIKKITSYELIKQ